VLRSIWFFIQFVLVAAAAIWIATQPGDVNIVWGDYTFSLRLGAFLLFLTVFILLALALFRLIGAIFNLPSVFGRYKKEKSREKGLRALTRGFVAVAAGDAKKATQFAQDVRRLMPGESGLPLLLEAQAARLRGDEAGARESFSALLEDKDAAFFGIKGLLKSSTDAGDMQGALGYARKALEQNPKQSWALASVYELEIQNGLWMDALRSLQKIRSLKVMDKDRLTSDEIALLWLLANEDEKAGNAYFMMEKLNSAYRLDPYFVPVISRLGQHLLNTSRWKMTGMIEKAWKNNPHPDLPALWDKLAPPRKPEEGMKRFKWHQKLNALHPNTVIGHVALAMVAMEESLWGQAKDHLIAAQNIKASVQVYRLRAKLEEQTTKDDVAMRHWLELAADAQPDDAWYCTRTGKIYDEWTPIAMPHGAFNTIRWGQPFAGLNNGQASQLPLWKDALMIDQG